MSIINATIFIQAIHFFIAFFLIKYFFFKPIVAQINAEDALQESLISTVQEHQIAVAQKERELLEHWQAMRAYFAKHVPVLKYEPFFVPKGPQLVFLRLIAPRLLMLRVILSRNYYKR